MDDGNTIKTERFHCNLCTKSYVQPQSLENHKKVIHEYQRLITAHMKLPT